MMANKNIHAVYQTCVSHLDAISTLDSSDIHFDFDNVQNWICSRSLPTPLSFDFCGKPITEAPIIFQVIGQISESKPITQGELETSFWIESRDDPVSRALWDRIPKSLEFIATSAKLKFDYSELCELGDRKLRVVWTPISDARVVSIGFPIQNGNQVAKRVPMFGTDQSGTIVETRMPVFLRGHPGVLPSLLGGQAVQVIFHLVYREKEDGELSLRASLINMASV